MINVVEIQNYTILLFCGHPVRELKEKRIERGTAGGDSMWKKVHGWTDDVISGVLKR